MRLPGNPPSYIVLCSIYRYLLEVIHYEAAGESSVHILFYVLYIDTC